MQTIYVDAGYTPGVGGHMAWFNKTTGKDYYDKIDCENSFHCEYVAILKAIEDHAEIINSGIEIEFLIDNETVQKQLNKQTICN